MKSVAFRLLILALSLAVLPDASAHGFGRRGPEFGFYFGDPFFYGPRYYYPPYYYPQPPVVVQQQPPVYVERQQATANLWYYCRQPAGYYPHVQNCSQQWIPVDPSSVPPQAPPPGAPR